MATDGEPDEEADQQLDGATRRAIFYARLAAADAFRDPDEALAAIEAILAAVEDEFSGVPADPNPGLETRGRMYPPKKDRIERWPDGSVTAEALGHTIQLGVDGSVTITRRSGGIEFEKAGHE